MRIAILGGTGAFGRALAERLVGLGEDVAIGSRDPVRARELGAVIGASAAANADAPEGADLVVLSVPSSAALDTARELAGSIGEIPLLCVASDLRFTDDGVEPGRELRSLAEDVAEILPGPVASGFQTLSAVNLARPELSDEDVFVCGAEAAKKPSLDIGVTARRRTCDRRRPTRELARAGGHDRRAAEREPALPRARGPATHRPALSELRVIPVEGLPEVRSGDDLGELLANAATFEKRRRAGRRPQGRVEGRGPRRPARRRRGLRPGPGARGSITTHASSR